jgi:broad specificity phosphatase PhoE
MKTQLYFLRHAKSAANELGIVQGEGLTVPLTVEGKKQAEIVAKKLKDFSFDRIFSGTSLRALETAKSIKSFHPQVPFFEEPKLNERSKGVGEGMLREEFNKKYPQIVKQWQEGVDARPEGGESFEDVQKRTVPVIEKHLNQDPSDSTLLYVTHGNVIRVLLGYMLEIPFSLRSQIHQDYCALNSVFYDHEKKKWEIEYINRVFKE